MENRTTDSFEFKFRLSEQQFRKAHQAYLRRSLLSVKNLFLVTVALAIGAVQAQLFGGADWALRVFGVIWAAVIGLVVFVYFRMPNRIYRNNPGLSGEQRFHIDDSGVEWGFEGHGRILQWSEISRASDNPDYIYFHPKHGLPWVLPKDAFDSEEQLKALDRYVAERLE